MTTLGRIRIVLWLLVGLGAVSFTILAWRLTGDGPGRQTALEPGRSMAAGADWRLVNDEGRPFTPADLAGSPTLIVFGFTMCPDVCPTSLAYVASVLQALGPEAETLRPVFLTVDPERDTVDVLAAYVALFDERIGGLTGPPEQVAAALKSLGAYARKVPVEGGDYTMDHTATMLLLDAEGRFRSTLDIHENPEVAVEKVRLLLGNRAAGA